MIFFWLVLKLEISYKRVIIIGKFHQTLETTKLGGEKKTLGNNNTLMLLLLFYFGLL